MRSETITVVSGLPRSGTSLMMKMLEVAGMSLLVDNIRKPDQDNPKGYYEFEPVKSLKDRNTDWLLGARGNVVKVVAPLLKYLSENQQYKIIFMHRAMPEILASQKKMLARRGKNPNAIPDEVIAAAFTKQVNDVFAWMESSPYVSFLDIDYAELVNGTGPVIQKLIGFLGIDADPNLLASVIDPRLYRQRINLN